MWNRKAAVSGLAIFTVAIAGACADDSLLHPRAESDENIALFGGGAMPMVNQPTIGIDAEFVRIASEVPGFAGWHFDEAGRLNVVMAPSAQALPEAEMQSRLASNLQALGENPVAAFGAVIQPGQYDFVELDAMHRRVMNVLSLAGVVYTDADEMLNRVVVGVENAAAARAVEHALGMLGVPAEAVVLRESGPFTPAVGAPLAGREVSPTSGHTLLDRIRPVAGGVTTDGQITCTVGFNVRSPTFPNAHGFVTSHLCTQVPGTVTNTPFWQPFEGMGDQIGVEVRDTMFHTGGICPAGRRCRLSASAGIRYLPGVSNAFARIYRTLGGPNAGTNEIDPANPMFNITAERSFPSVGNLMHTVGAGSGWTTGTVTQSCVMVNVAASDITYRCQEVSTGADGVIAPGDAGAPVFEPTPGGGPNDVRLIGMTWGTTAANNFVWSAMIEIRSDNPARPAGQGGAWRTFPPPPAP